ncbi:MAG TPA: GH3 auxin-responsive promoter family protein [Opitutaceae bacterium]|nr:GH3 auxin-responsive promoter family protein [Opitutaceae bacterium]
MPAWPKSFLTFGTSLLTTRTARRLRIKSSAVPAQQRTWKELTEKLRTATFWRSAGVEAGMSYAQFKSRVVPRKYEDVAAAIEKMKRGEAGVLWPGQCVFYAVSAGTSGGPPKSLPVTAEMLVHFRRAGMQALLYYTARTGNAGVFRGRHLFLGGSTALTLIGGTKRFTAYAGNLSGITELNLPRTMEKHLYEPGSQIGAISDWPTQIQAIADRTIPLDISLIAGLPNWVAMLAEAMKERKIPGKASVANLKDIWPNLECFVHCGIPVGPFFEDLHTLLGPGVNFQEVYPASEGFIAAQDGEASAGMRLIADAGIFYEFLPLEGFDEARLSQLADKVIPLEGVATGVDYVLLVTTPGGLCRHIIGDVVRFTSIEPFRLQYVGRTKLQLNTFGERVIEKDITDALLLISQRNGWTIVNFHVAPLFTNPLLGTSRGRHEWWVELRPGTVITPTGPQMAIELDAELQRLNGFYDSKRKNGGLEAPLVRLVMPGLFEHWMRHQNKWGGQNKMPRCRNDRLVADELAQLANFAKD